MLDPRLTDLVHAIRASTAPPCMRTKVVAVDGRGGAGKSSLARLLSVELGAPIVHTDDFASWDNPIDWWPGLIESVLEPLASGNAARYLPTTWGGPPRSEVVVAPREYVLLEGVTASREAFRGYLAYSIWIETAQAIRLRRGLERDGEEALPDWERWMAEEDAYVAREHPAQHADVVIPGDADLWS